MNNLFKTLMVLVLCSLMQISAFAENNNQNTAGTDSFSDINAFMESYANDLRTGNREAVVARYDSRGAFFVGQGQKKLKSGDDIKKQYLEIWHPPVSFAWHDLSFEPVGDNAIVVTGLFDWGISDTVRITCSYTGLMIRDGKTFKIRLEDESPLPKSDH